MIKVEVKKNETGPATFNLTLKPLRIVFMGTPDFAVTSLEALMKAGFNIVGVITSPDKPGGRGLQLQQSAVKKYALANDLLVLQPEKLKDPVFIEQLQQLNADLQIVVAFRMLPEIIWDMPRMGTLNLHGSLLPQYRGAAPINWAVINGENETGVTIFKLKHDIDTGNILLQKRFPILPNENAGQVHDKMKVIGAEVLVEAVKGLLNGSLVEKPQSEFDIAAFKAAPKIFKEDCQIDFTKSVIQIYNFIRGLSPYPGAFCIVEGKVLKIFKAEMGNGIILPDIAQMQAGQIITDGKSYLALACADDFIFANEVQLEGKKRMSVTDFLRGWKKFEK